MKDTGDFTQDEVDEQGDEQQRAHAAQDDVAAEVAYPGEHGFLGCGGHNDPPVGQGRIGAVHDLPLRVPVFQKPIFVRGGFLDEALFGDIVGEHLVTVPVHDDRAARRADENVPHAVEGDGIDDKAREVLHVDRADEHAGYFAPVIDGGGDDERLFLRIGKDKRTVEGLCALQRLVEIGGGFPAGGVLARIDAGDHGPPAIEDGQPVDAWEVEHGPPQMTGKELAPFALGGFIRVAEQLDDGDAIRHCEQMLAGEIHDGGEFAPHGVERGNFKDAGSLGHGIPGVAVCLPSDEGRGERHNDADGNDHARDK